MKFSIITVVRNGAASIGAAVESVLAQSHRDLELIVVDGASTDNTVELVRGYGAESIRLISEPDRGIFDAMNKGLGMARGEVVAFLNSDDHYTDPEVVAEVNARMEASSVAALFADVVLVDGARPERVARYYSAGDFRPSMLKRGWIPPHPGVFIRRQWFVEHGGFDSSYRIAGDFELLARFMLVHGMSYLHLPRAVVNMRTGGISTSGWRSSLIITREILRACRANGIATSLPTVLSRYPEKFVRQILCRPSTTP